MAFHFSLYPTGLGNNKCYLFIMEAFTQDQLESWNVYSLYKDFGKDEVEILINLGFLIKERNQQVSLPFNLLGSPANIILEFVTREIYSFTELLVKLPKHMKISSKRLRNYLLFLTNFNLIQIFPWPNSGITCVAVDGQDHMEKLLDYGFCLSDKLETQYIYQADPCEGTEELAALMVEAFKKCP
jgi:hypothetical protein